MKIVLSILIWVIIALVIIWGTKSIITRVKEIKARKMKNKETITQESENNIEQEQKKGE